VAIYKMLTEGGFENVYHVSGGIREWCACVRACVRHSLLRRAGVLTAAAMTRDTSWRRAERELPMEGEDIDKWRSMAGKTPKDAKE
jgi:hypothetical protein